MTFGANNGASALSNDVQAAFEAVLPDITEDYDEEDSFDENETYDMEQKGQSLEIQTHSMERMAKTTICVILIVLLGGAGAGLVFMFTGISTARDQEESVFKRRASDLAKEIESSWRDYENAALWLHETSYRRDFTYHDYHSLYEYLISAGLEFQGANVILNLTHSERSYYEALAREYYEANYPDFEYIGFKGLEPDPNDPSTLMMQSRSEQPRYLTISFVEPVVSNEAVIGLDLLSLDYIVPYVRKAFDEWKPVLTGPVKLVQETVEGAYGTILYHPGIPLEGRPDITKPRDLSQIVVRIPALLSRAARLQSDNLAAYLYDVTYADGTEENPPGVLGAIKIKSNAPLTFPPETPYVNISKSGDLYFEQDVNIATRTWRIVILPVDDSFEPTLGFIVFGGAMVFVGALILAVWMIHNMRKSAEIHKITTKAAAEASIVANLFPPKVRERMIQDAKRMNKVASNPMDFTKAQEYDGNEAKLNIPLTSDDVFGSRPIAELHPETTVMFADLVGFTPWSSVREPSHVFTLLEIVYHSFDCLAKRRRVFKVETVGDCYVAVTGLPHARKDHAVVAAKFANDCLQVANKLFKALEVTLGPDTGDLGLRIGLHSGQVTAGVLRGDKGRFQLFGDTVNFCARLEATSLRGKIQASQETVDLLEAAGKGAWVIPRPDKIDAKGKGFYQAYFVKVCEESTGTRGSNAAVQVGRRDRLINWNVEVLAGLLKTIQARREAASKKSEVLSFARQNGSITMALDEVQEVITLPTWDEVAIGKQVEPASIRLEPQVTELLRDYVVRIAKLYRGNEFHCFEHASHVVMSVLKMLSRIVNPKEVAIKQKHGDYATDAMLEADLHDHTFGITSDPLTQFACAFSALIHDVDHQGVTNAVLINENSDLALKYKGKSVAEQNSIDLAWDILMEAKYSKLRSTICCDNAEFKRFRQLVVNSVCATDIMDKKLGEARKARWNKAFLDAEQVVTESKSMATNRKATIVIEHLIQASDVSHTMQHWHIYIKWNEKLFVEQYKAFEKGRINEDPSVNWYRGEIGFFDFYIIPLVNKLFKCGVFGVSSHEYLNYAMVNRKEWEEKGEAMVAQYLKKYKEQKIERGIAQVDDEDVDDVANHAEEQIRSRLMDRLRASSESAASDSDWL